MGKRLRSIGGLCKRNHRLTADNVDLIGRDKVRCRTCARDSQRRTKGHQPRHYNRLGGTCSKGHPLTIATVYRRPTGGYQCAVCLADRRAKPETKPAPPVEKTCARCGETKLIAAFPSPGRTLCRRCRDAKYNAPQLARARLATVSRRAEARSIVGFCRTGTARLVERGWTATDVALGIGVSPKSFGRWLLEDRLPQPHRVTGLAEAMAALLAREGLI